MKKIFFSLFIYSLLLSSCGGSKKVSDTTNEDDQVRTEEKTTVVNNEQTKKTENSNLDFDVLRYIAKYKTIAKKEMKEYGIPASITLAQGILESQSGKSRLAVEGNNHFGIKCHNDWHGKTILHDDNKAQECFRKYINPEESFKDHSRFLAERKRYAFLFRLPKTDYEAWARGLKKAGYATDPSYPDKLIYIIDKYNLAKLDKEVLQEMSVKITDNQNEEDGNKRKKFIYEVQEGETLFTIARKFNIPVKDIQRINNLNDFDIYQGQILVLTESENVNETPKEKQETVQKEEQETNIEKADTTPQTNERLSLHTVKQGETLFSISKDYHISLEDLREVNGLADNEIKVGDVLKIPLDRVQKEEKKLEENQNNSSSEAVYHIVQPGETLYRIHINYKVSISQLRKLNHLKGNYIKVGQKLRIK